MIKIGVADYGMNVWDGALFDYGQRCQDIKSIGYDGLERLRPISPDDAIHKAAMVKKLGMDFATCQASTAEHSIEWTAALGKEYVWTNVSGKDFKTMCRQVNTQAKAAGRYGVKAAVHNHMDSLVETQEEVLAFLSECPDCGIILDTGHLTLAKGGDPVHIVENYFDRIVAVHLKDWMMTNPDEEKWFNRGYACELGGGNYKIENEKVVRLLIEKGYNKWILVEHDTHLQDPLIDLKKSRDVLKSWGV